MIIKKGFKLIILFVLFSHYGYTKTINIKYRATFGIFGTVGTITTKLIKKRKTYKIYTKITVNGIAKFMLKNHTERHISKGDIKNGVMISNSYQVIRKNDTKTESKKYWINHKKRYVVKRVKEWKNGKLIKNRKRTLRFYAKDDILSFYFNLDKVITKKGKKYRFKVVGLEKQKGVVYITVPDKSEYSSYRKDLGGHNNWYAKALIHQKNFRKKKGNILLSIGEDGIIKKSVIKDILFYGDAKIERIY